MAQALVRLADENPLRGSRLATLRHMEGITQAELASRLAVSQSFVSQVEKGAKLFPCEVAEAACREFGLPFAFFTVGPDPSSMGVATFRRAAKASARDSNRVTALFDEAARLFRVASHASGYRVAELSELADVDEEEAASSVRQVLKIGVGEPIPNATRALERLGVGVVQELAPMGAGVVDHHGLSRPHGDNDRPLVATIGEQPPAVTRLTLMHELGHLVYDVGLSMPIRSSRAPQELRAFRFAGAMLVPAAVVRERVSESLTLHGYLRIKADYGVSVSALVKRAQELGVISSSRARSLFIQISSQGWRRAEPVEVAAEKPLLLSQAVRKGIGVDVRSVAEATGVAGELVKHWTDLEEPVERPGNVVPLRRPR